MKHDRTEWTRGATGDHKIKNKTYKNLTEFSRKCATCEQPFSIFVTEKIATGLADTNSFGLKNCPEHRRNPVRSVDEVELETLRMANHVMKEELAGLYTRLAQYELQPAVRAASSKTKPLTKSFPWA